MRAVAVHPDVLVVTSRMWQINATALRAGGECMLVDSPYFPDELEALPGLLAQAGFEPNALLATHADFDHLLARFAYPDLNLGVGEDTGEHLRREPGSAQRALRDFDAEHYVVRPSPLSLGRLQSLPAPGSVDLGDDELELHPAPGHTADGVAFLARSLGVLMVGDYISDVEIPWLSPSGAVEDYRATLARLGDLVETAAETVVPGHGALHSRKAALRIVDEDLGYLDALERGEERPALPKGRDTRVQRRIHRENLGRVTGAPTTGT